MNIRIDLNGYNISLAPGVSGSVIRVTGCSNLEIINTKITDKGSVVNFKEDPNTGRYIQDNNGNISFNGGCIYGGNAVIDNSSNSEYNGKGGAIYVSKDSYVALHDVNVVGNNAEWGGAFYNEGQLVYNNLKENISNKQRQYNSVISGNTAKCGGAAYSKDCSGLLIDGVATHNAASDLAGGLYAEGLFQWGPKFGCFDNRIINANTLKNNEFLYEDIVFQEFQYNNDNLNSSKGTAIVLFNDLINIDKQFVRVKCLSGNETKFSFTINETEELDAKNIIANVLLNDFQIFAFTMMECAGVYKMESTGNIVFENSKGMNASCTLAAPAMRSKLVRCSILEGISGM